MKACQWGSLNMMHVASRMLSRRDETTIKKSVRKTILVKQTWCEIITKLYFVKYLWILYFFLLASKCFKCRCLVHLSFQVVTSGNILSLWKGHAFCSFNATIQPCHLMRHLNLYDLITCLNNLWRYECYICMWPAVVDRLDWTLQNITD